MIASMHRSVQNSMQRPISRDDRRNAFALLMVIACLTLIILALVGATRRSLLLALESRHAVDTLHRRWSEITLERAGLAAGIEFYGKTSSADLTSQGQPLRHQFELPVRLNQQRYQLLIADESSKANLSTLLRYKSSEEVRAVANRLSNYQMRDLRLPSRRVNVDFSGEVGRNRSAIRSWGDVLPIGSNDPDQWALGELPQHTQRLTVFGDN